MNNFLPLLFLLVSVFHAHELKEEYFYTDSTIVSTDLFPEVEKRFEIVRIPAEKTLYHADQVAYWAYSQRLAQALAADAATALRAVANSVANNDLNLLPALPVAIVMAGLGDSRLVYVLAVVNIYGAATALMLVVALRRFGARRAPWVAALALLLVAVPWRAIFIGYLDIGGVALALAVLALTRPDPAGLGPGRAAGAGAVLALLALFRRWWGIWAVAFCLALAADAAVTAARARHGTRFGAASRTSPARARRCPVNSFHPGRNPRRWKLKAIRARNAKAERNGTTAQADIEVFSHVRQSDFRLINWGRATGAAGCTRSKAETSVPNSLVLGVTDR